MFFLFLLQEGQQNTAEWMVDFNWESVATVRLRLENGRIWRRFFVALCMLLCFLFARVFLRVLRFPQKFSTLSCLWTINKIKNNDSISPDDCIVAEVRRKFWRTLDWRNVSRRFTFYLHFFLFQPRFLHNGTAVWLPSFVFHSNILPG